MVHGMLGIDNNLVDLSKIPSASEKKLEQTVRNILYEFFNFFFFFFDILFILANCIIRRTRLLL